MGSPTTEDAVCPLKQSWVAEPRTPDEGSVISVTVPQAALMMVGGPFAPVFPVAPVAPAGPLVPVLPVAPEGPVEPVAPEGPVEPVAPTAPVAPVAPTAPVAPVAPTAPVAPVAPTAPVAPVAPAAPVAPCDIAIGSHSGLPPDGLTVHAHSAFVVLLNATAPVVDALHAMTPHVQRF